MALSIHFLHLQHPVQVCGVLEPEVRLSCEPVRGGIRPGQFGQSQSPSKAHIRITNMYVFEQDPKLRGKKIRLNYFYNADQALLLIFFLFLLGYCLLFLFHYFYEYLLLLCTNCILYEAYITYKVSNLLSAVSGQPNFSYCAFLIWSLDYLRKSIRATEESRKVEFWLFQNFSVAPIFFHNYDFTDLFFILLHLCQQVRMHFFLSKAFFFWLSFCKLFSMIPSDFLMRQRCFQHTIKIKSNLKKSY